MTTSYRNIIIGLSALVLLLSLNVYFDFRREKKLKDSIQTYAKIVFRGKYLTKAHGAKVKFLNHDKKWIIAPVRCDCRYKSIGDTVIIKYARSDSKLVKMVEKNPTAKDLE